MIGERWAVFYLQSPAGTSSVSTSSSVALWPGPSSAVSSVRDSAALCTISSRTIALASTGQHWLTSPHDDNCSYKQRCVTLTETECDRVPECSLVSEEQCTTNTRQQCREEPRQNCRTELQTVCGNNFSFGNNLYGDNLYDGKFYGKRQAPTSTLKNSTFTTKTLLPSPGQPKVSRAFQGGDNF